MPSVELSASLLAADCLDLGRISEQLLASCKIDRLHIDAMDGVWVPHLFPGALLCAALRRSGVSAPIDVHLMVSCVVKQVETCIEAGATTVWFHPEVMDNEDAIAQALDALADAGVKAGLVLGPNVSFQSYAQWADQVDDWLVLSVLPGACGQPFQSSAFDTIKAIRLALPEARISVDGGVNAKNAAHLVAAGVNALVVGSGLFDRGGQVSVDACQQLRTICEGNNAQ